MGKYLRPGTGELTITCVKMDDDSIVTTGKLLAVCLDETQSMRARAPGQRQSTWGDQRALASGELQAGKPPRIVWAAGAGGEGWVSSVTGTTQRNIAHQLLVFRKRKLL